jgi:hypothetical protein
MQTQISLRYYKHIGPKYLHGDVTLQFDSLQPYSFSSEAKWPNAGNYDEQIRQAVEEALLEHQRYLNRMRVVLKKIEWDEIESCALGFQLAAKAAVHAAFAS